MTVSEILDAYVFDVAKNLPRAKRDDVAFELRALLGDELAAKAKEAGREADKPMVMAMLAEFGRPAAAAARYHQRPAVIEAEDTPRFTVWALGGVLVIAVLSALSETEKAKGSDYLQWLGALVVVFGVMGWLRRRSTLFGWKPRRVRDVYHVTPWVNVVLGVLSLIPLGLVVSPEISGRVVTFGLQRGDGLLLEPTYAYGWLRGALLAALALQAAMYVYTAIDGTWRRWSRWAMISLMMGVGLLMVGHVGVAKEKLLFVSAKANVVATPILGAVAALMFLSACFEMYREWARVRPAPAGMGPEGGKVGAVGV